MPIIDAFNTGAVEIKQTWLPDLLINYKHKRVARFDRCTTCHLGIDKTQPGTADVPGFAHEQLISAAMQTPSEAPQATVAITLRQMDKDQDGLISREEATDDLRENFGQFDRSEDGSIDRDELTEGYIEQHYGLLLADRGMLADDDVTVAGVRPESPAAKAGLLAGDVLYRISDVEITDKQLAHRYLLDSVRWGEPISITLRRGLPHPYSTHPRLDLFVGSLSPHNINDFGCTICHDGQGSATSFKWSSHTPNTPFEEGEWKSEHDWFNNHFWEYPMKPSRFVESNCIKCHHEVTELEPSQKYREPPAPKVVRGFNLVREFGCFGCHEINGFDGPHRRVGPDLRAEPNYFAAAAQLLTVPGLNEQEKELAQRVIAHPEDGESRHRLAELIQADASAGEGDSSQRRFGEAAYKLAGMVGADTDTPGRYRKVGPSLRHVRSKVDFDFLYNWVQEPKDFRPATRMPQFFGLNDHLLSAHQPTARGEAEHETGSPDGGGETANNGNHKGLHEAERFEPVEIHGIVSYLLAKSQPFEYLGRPEGVIEAPSAERGEWLFETRGCLACHKHEKFPQAREDQGPDLSRLGSKLRTPDGQSWLYSWLRDPSRYHARTKMPNVFLEPIRETVKEGDNARQIVTDPAADIAAFLLASQGWEAKQPPRVDETAVDELAHQYLTGSGTTRVQATRYLKEGISSSLASELAGDEVELVVGEGEPITIEHKLLYVGRRAIAKYGCSGCHDIPGFEDAKPIGTGLADWGRKDLSQLAFEQISHYIEETEAGAEHDIYAAVKDMDPDKGYFIEQLLAHQREGFIWQKLRAPRSYDFKKTENKTYNERLRMPKFPITPEDIEAVATFVLGLVAEPPAARYIYEGDARQQAIVQGRQVIDMYNCAGCHTLDMETWEFD
ncbi:MAG: c-type cytochrome, partial [Planctomycetes bacterium]|nr:c-type cytochrome [Planctomycetota bacterium]